MIAFFFSCYATIVMYIVVVQSLSHVQLCSPMDCSTPSCSSSPSPRICSNSCPLSRWCHPTISSSVVPFSSCPQSFPASGSFPMTQLFVSGGQSIGAPASSWVLPMNIQDWFPSGLTGWISLQSKGLSRVFSNIIVHNLETVILSDVRQRKTNIIGYHLYVESKIIAHMNLFTKQK